MDKLVVPIPSNGFPLNNDDIRFFLGLTPYSNGLYQALEGILTAYGNNYIVSGCGVSGSDIAEGWVMLDGELIKVDAHTAADDYFEKVVTYNANGNKQTQTGSTEDSYQQNRATATASSGNLESPVTGSPQVLNNIPIALDPVVVKNHSAATIPQNSNNLKYTRKGVNIHITGNIDLNNITSNYFDIDISSILNGGIITNGADGIGLFQSDGAVSDGTLIVAYKNATEIRVTPLNSPSISSGNSVLYINAYVADS